MLTSDFERCRKIAEGMRRDMIMLADPDGCNAHWGGSLSCTDILSVLYGAVANTAKEGIDEAVRDRIIISKGHSSLALYAALLECGVIGKDGFLTFQKDGSALTEHSTISPSMKIDCSTGSLGTGCSMGVGMAFAAKRKNYPWHTYILVGDGECDEGIVWEAAMAAAQFKLDNLTLIMDWNGFQADGANDDILSLGDPVKKFEAFGWQAEMVDGHDLAKLYDALSGGGKAGKPHAVIAKTIKGKGVSFMENDWTWHHKVLNKELLEQAKKEVGLL